MELQKSRRRIAALALFASVVTGSSLLTALPAQAAVFDCPTGQTCDWHGGNYDGTRWGTNGSVAVYSSSNAIRTSSMANRSTRGARWFVYENYGGVVSFFLSGGDVAQLGGGVYNDRWRSKTH